jgi:hypothetical protein
MAVHQGKKLCWMQRIALVRYNLRSAARTGDFTFFKTLQAQAFLEGTDYVATLQSSLGDEADTVLHTLDDLNAGMAYVHQDSFKSVYDAVRANIGEDKDSRLAKLCVDVSQEKQKADFSIDKMANSATELCNMQPSHCQETVAAVWVIGATIVADAIKVCIDQMDQIELCMDDFVRLEYSWHLAQTAVEASVSAIRGIFNLMVCPAPFDTRSRTMSTSSSASPTSSVFKRLSTVLFHSPINQPSTGMTVPQPQSHPKSFSTPNHFRSSVAAAVPTHVPPPVARSAQAANHQDRKLSTIPPTPFGLDEVNPFEMDFNMNKAFNEIIQV